MRHVAAAVATVALTLLADASFAGVGDYRLVQGRIAVWPPEPFAYGVAVLQTDSGQPYFLEFSPVTAGATGLQPGDTVAVVGREGLQADRLAALTIERRGAAAGAATPGWQTVSGLVESTSGSTAIMRLADGRRIALDLSQMGGDRIRAVAGQELTVTGLMLTPTLISARGLATSSETPAALPRQVAPIR
jgi:hypothetical protein